MEYLPYVVTEFFCIILAVTMLLRLNANMGMKYEIKKLKELIFSFILVAGTDMIWALTEGKIIRPGLMLNAVVNGLSIAAVAAGCYFWFLFIEMRIRPGYVPKKITKILVSIPAFFICILDLVSVFTKWVFYIDPEGRYSYGKFFWMQAVITYVYLIIPTVGSIICAVRTSSKNKRAECFSYATFMIGSLVIGIYEDKLPQVPLLVLAIYLELHILFLSIYMDRERELAESRIDLMLSQIQPHFIYNSLAVIQEMCHGKAPEAEETTIEFARFLRGNIDSLSQKELISFDQELEHTKYYLSIEQKRFGKEILHTEFRIGVTDFYLPSLTLQPIVENAVKHGIMKRVEGGTVTVVTEEHATEYVIRVIDDGVGFESDDKESRTGNAGGHIHVGLQNVKGRLQTMCGGNLSVKSEPDHGTEVSITIPKNYRA